MNIYLIIIAFSSLISLNLTSHGKENPVSQMIERLAPGKSKHFELVEQKSNGNDGLDEFEIRAGQNGKIILAGNSRSAQAGAFGYYLKNVAKGHLSWSGDRIPADFPLPAEPIKVSSPYKFRQGHNFCVFGYTTPFWSFKRWEREVDFLAANGFNQILITAGSEKVWYHFLKKLGYPEDRIRAFIAHPAYSPWWHMGNLEGEGGPLSDALIERQAKLGKALAQRCSELGIMPATMGFVGLLPNDIGQYVHDLKLIPQGQWVAGYQRPIVLDPTHQSFPKIADLWYETVEEVYGSPLPAYAGDLFHEGGKSAGIDLTAAAKAVQDAMRKRSPSAIWIIQSWQSNPPKQLVAGTDPDHTLILQLCRNMKDGNNGGSIRGYQGREWLWGELNNFGGNHNLYGGLPLLASIPEKLQNSAWAPGNPVGISLQSEGFEHNPVYYELFFDLAWQSTDINLDQWLTKYIERRYGKAPTTAIDAWQLLKDSVYSPTGIQEGCTESILCARPDRNARKASSWSTGEVRYDPKQVVKAAELLVAAAPDLSEHSRSYFYDLVDVTRQMMADLARPLLASCFDSYDIRDLAEFDRKSQLFLDLLKDSERLLASHPDWLFGTWTEPAWEMGDNQKDKAHCLELSKRLVTTWSEKSDSLDDYAHRQLAGLIKDYYLPRWEAFFDDHRKVVQGSLDSAHVANWYRDQRAAQDLEFAKSPKRYTTMTRGDTLDIAQNLVAKYSDVALELHSRQTQSKGFPWQIKQDSETFEFDVSEIVLSAGTYRVKVQYEKGQSALAIHSVALYEGDQKVAEDVHEGWTGIDNRNNIYALKLDKYRTNLDVYTLKIKASAVSSIDSKGSITINKIY